MPLPKLQLSPDSDQYAVNDGQTTIAVQLSGGPSRFRRDYIGAPAQVTVQWTISKKNYNYLRAFYRTTILDGSQPFLIDLLFDNGTVTEYTARFMPNTFGLHSQRGLTFTVAAVLEVMPLTPDATADAALVTAGPE